MRNPVAGSCSRRSGPARHSAGVDCTLTGGPAGFAFFAAREEASLWYESGRGQLQSAKRAARHSAGVDCTLTGGPPDSPSSLPAKSRRPARTRPRAAAVGEAGHLSSCRRVATMKKLINDSADIVAEALVGIEASTTRGTRRPCQPHRLSPRRAQAGKVGWSRAVVPARAVARWVRRAGHA